MKYDLFTLKEYYPSGWILRQLQIQAQGLSGNLDKVWPDVRDSAWVGGDREGWERVPYWLDGFIPLAYLLQDEDLIARAQKYIDAVLAVQNDDGWICPCKIEEREKYDLWAYLLICKVLALYAEISRDSRAEEALYRALRCLYDLLEKKKVTLFGWGQYRWFEGLIPILYIKKKYDEPWLSSLAMILREQGADYKQFVDRWKTPKTDWTLETHIVNLSMIPKIEALCREVFGEEKNGESEYLWQMLEQYNGTAVGTFTGDECLSGVGNNRGTELCAVVELMYSCEVNFLLTGDALWLERLEKAAFNALPATLSDDMWTHQYVQSVNQIACRRFPGQSFFRTNGREANLFGLEPNYGCCTANFNQGWPKFARMILLRGKNEILHAIPLPALLETAVDGKKLRVEVKSEYPFRHTVKYIVEAKDRVDIDLKVRVPAFAKKLKVNGVPIPKTDVLLLGNSWKGKTEIVLEFSDVPHFVQRPRDLKVVEYGPLVFSLPLKAEWEKREYTAGGVERKYPYCDYELNSGDEWRYGFADVTFEVEEKQGDDVPFSSKSPRIVLKTKMKRAAWNCDDGYDSIANDVPCSDKAVNDDAEEKELYPYGCAKLRMTEMPLLK